MSDPYVGEIRIFAGNFAPRGWARCEGQLLPIQQNTALFSLLGTYYGGDGRTTFALPDLRGAAPMMHGSGPGLTPRTLGDRVGSETVILVEAEMPAHTHRLTGVDADAVSLSAAAAFPAHTSEPIYREPGVSALAPNGAAGGSLPHPNRQPVLASQFIIALSGTFPPRD